MEDVSELPFREVPLGGPRAMLVRRTLPQRSRPTVGAWCFADHYGSDDDPLPPRMLVPPHPHIGLQTVTWLVAGAVRHRDGLGSDVTVTPGQLSMMTAGRGIAHSEYSVGAGPLHGVQLWVALPEASRHGAPAFAHHDDLPVRERGGVRLTVFVGALDGLVSPAPARTPLLGAEIHLAAGATLTLPLEPALEHGLLVLAGAATVAGRELGRGPLLVLPVGRPEVTVAAQAPTRLLLLGGEPFVEPLLMWWNFVGRDHKEIEAARSDWEAQRRHGGERFGAVAGEDESLPAPAMPGVRLRPRGPVGAPAPPLS